MTSNKSFLITGGAGFVGAHVTESIARANPNSRIVVVDSLNYSGSLDRLRETKMHEDMPNGTTLLDRVELVTWDLRVPAEPNLIKELMDTTHILHLAAESHVDNSIEDPMKFVMSNVVGTTNLLQMARQLPNLKMFLYFNTDEVFGSAPMWEFKGHNELDKHTPMNPYAATKSAASQMVNAFANTYKLPCVETFTMNVFGERQHAEKFIPKCIRAAITGEVIPIHSTPDKKQAGIRSYIHARNVGAALNFIIGAGDEGRLSNGFDLDKFNIVGEREVDNRELALLIDGLVGTFGPMYGYKPAGLKYEMVDFHSSRPGHDLRYKLDGTNLSGAGFTYPSNFEKSLRDTVVWYLKNGKV